MRENALRSQRFQGVAAIAAAVLLACAAPAASQDGVGRQDRTLRIDRPHQCAVESVTFSPDGKQALIGYAHGTLVLWDIASGRKLRSLEGHRGAVHSVAFSPDGRQAISACFQRIVIVWNLRTGRKLRSFQGHTDLLWSLDLSPDGRQALTGSQDKTLILWDVETGRRLRSMAGHRRLVVSVAISPNGRQALSGSEDRTMILWDLTTGRILRNFEGHAQEVISVAFRPEGDQALSASLDGTLILWEVATGRKLQTFRGHKSQVWSAAISRDGRRALSGSDDGTIILWDLETGRKLHSLEGHTDRVSAVAFGPDGRCALSASRDGTARLWDVAAAEERAILIALDRGAEWVTVTPQGFFTGTPGSRTLVGWRVGSAFYPLNLYEKPYNRPDVVASRLQGAARKEQTPALDRAPPAIESITAAPKGTSFEIKALVTGGSATARIVSIELTIDGTPLKPKRVIERPRKDASTATYRAVLELPPGKNKATVEAVAIDEMDLMSPPAKLTVVRQ